MGFYQDHIVPVLINLAMRRQELVAYRSHVIPAAEGRVLEIGVGAKFAVLLTQCGTPCRPRSLAQTTLDGPAKYEAECEPG
jgi:hypothetical protein